MRAKIVAGNWKMNKTVSEGAQLVEELKSGLAKVDASDVTVVVSPTYVSLSEVVKIAAGSLVNVAAQNVHQEANGAYTGEISADMLKSVGVGYVIIGHSENRTTGETDLIINKKIKSSINNGLKIIFCIGETLLQRKKKLTHKILKNQISKGLKGVKKLNKVLFAYEPVWSIGTGIVPKANDLEKNVNFIRNNLSNKFRLKNPKILYGGSVNTKNVKNLKEINIIDGFLIGAASQDPKKFIDIVKKTFN